MRVQFRPGTREKDEIAHIHEPEQREELSFARRVRRLRSEPRQAQQQRHAHDDIERRVPLRAWLLPWCLRRRLAGHHHVPSRGPCVIGAEFLPRAHRAISEAKCEKDEPPLERLKTTVVTTNIRVKKTQKTTMFSWIDQWDDLIDAKTRESRGLTLTVSDWFYRGVTEDGGVLSIDPAYFSITGGRERWLYRVARKHAGGNGANGFSISMPTLFEKSGAEGTYRRFKFETLKIIQRNDLPGFSLFVRSQAEGEPVIHMLRRDCMGEGEQHIANPPAKHASRPRPQPQNQPSRIDDLPLLTPLIRSLSDRLIAQIRREFPGWDIYALQTTFNEWVDEDPTRTPKDYEAAFYGWVRQHHAQNQAHAY